MVKDDGFTPEQLEKWDHDHVWHSFTQMRHYESFVVESAQGCRLKDIHGNEFIDGVSSLWCNVHGHGHPVLNNALRRQMEQVSHVTNLGASHSTTIRLAKKLVEITPGNLNHVFFCSDGANAVEVALKMAFQYWQQCETPQPNRTKYV
ncbi:MAG: aminotransferase class III-fold pyridoxal phosphate-dependent enzyme, partial [Planctomycetota bacterium]|nr:aminotransferase class III-fold pyridoxal phosphate-dependent enzyme [Planctomycetota bacterium]